MIDKRDKRDKLPITKKIKLYNTEFKFSEIKCYVDHSEVNYNAIFLPITLKEYSEQKESWSIYVIDDYREIYLWYQIPNVCRHIYEKIKKHNEGKYMPYFTFDLIVDTYRYLCAKRQHGFIIDFEIGFNTCLTELWPIDENIDHYFN